MSTALTFNEVSLYPVTYENQIWLRSGDIAKALGYKTENAITKIFNRNSDEFSNDMTVVPNLGTTEKPNMVRIFSLRGCHLLAMFSRTPIAKAFRKWVLDVLDNLDKPKAIPQPTTPSTADSRKPLRALVHAWSQITGLHHAALWPQVRGHFQLSRIDDLPEEWLPDALAFVQSKIDAQQQPQPIEAKPSVPAINVTGRRTKPYNTIREIMSAFEQAHTDCVFAQAPEGYSQDDKAGALRYAIQEELYKNCMASLRAAQFALAASSRVAEWA